MVAIIFLHHLVSLSFFMEYKNVWISLCPLYSIVVKNSNLYFSDLSRGSQSFRLDVFSKFALLWKDQIPTSCLLVSSTWRTSTTIFPWALKHFLMAIPVVSSNTIKLNKKETINGYSSQKMTNIFMEYWPSLEIKCIIECWTQLKRNILNT